MDMSKVALILFEGAKVSIKIFAFTLLFSIPLGMLVALGKKCRFKPLKWLINLYILIMRGTPLMLQIIVVFFAIPMLKQNTPFFLEGFFEAHPDINIDRFAALIVAFSFNYAAYFAEIFRGGIDSIPIGNYEAAFSLGFTKTQTFFKIILPQVIKRVIPATSNEVITLVKDTSLASVILATELYSKANKQMIVYGSLTPLFLAGLFYLIMNTVLTIAFALIEKKLDYYR